MIVKDMKVSLTTQMKAYMAMMEAKMEKMYRESWKGKELIVGEEEEDDDNTCDNEEIDDEGLLYIVFYISSSNTLFI